MREHPNILHTNCNLTGGHESPLNIMGLAGLLICLNNFLYLGILVLEYFKFQYIICNAHFQVSLCIKYRKKYNSI